MKARSKVTKVDDQLSMLIRLLRQQPDLTQHLAQLNVPEQTNPDHTGQSIASDEQDFRSVDRLCLGSTALASPSPETIGNSQAPPGHTYGRVLDGIEATSAMVPIPREVALHLIDIYFDKVAPWLPLLHRPSFVEYCSQNLCTGPDSLATLPTEYALILLSMFSLSARFSPLDQHWKEPPRDRGHRYAEEAKRVYAKVRTLHEPSLRYLQGCILLAFHCYSSGMSLQGWVLVGVCIHFALDLGLSDIDREPTAPDLPASPVEVEELRRAWWSVWELDTFGSIILTRPFAVDRRHVAVKLPISDQAWFAGEHVESETLRCQKCTDWNSLRASPNQDPRAWYLVTNSFLAKIFDRLLLRESISLEDQTVFENELSCLKFTLPAVFHRQPGHLPLENGPAVNNWIVGTHIFLSAASHMIFVLSTIQEDGSIPSQEMDSAIAHEKFRVAELSSILRMWPPGCISTAHPFLVTSICPMFELPPKTILDSLAYQSFEAMVLLIQASFGEYWELGRLALKISQVLRTKGLNSTKEVTELVRRYPVYLKPLPSYNRRVSVSTAGSERSDQEDGGRPSFLASPSNPLGIDSPGTERSFGFGEPSNQFLFSDMFFQYPNAVS